MPGQGKVVDGVTKNRDVILREKKKGAKLGKETFLSTSMEMLSRLKNVKILS
jgi:hypothetical protein